MADDFVRLQRKFVKAGLSVAKARQKAEAIIIRTRTSKAQENKAAALKRAESKRAGRAR